MIKTVFRSDCVPAAERLARFDELPVNSEHPMHVLSDNPEGFHAIAQVLDLSVVNVLKLTCSPFDMRRTPKLIREKDPELSSIVFALCGEVGVAQADREATLRAHDFALYDSSRPLQLRIGAARGTTTLIRAHAPRSLLRLPTGRTDDLLALSLPGRSGVGALLTQFLTSLTRDAASYRANDVPRLSGVAVDLLTAALAHRLDAAGKVPDDSRRRLLLLRAEVYAKAHLHEPQLSPRSVAAALNVSVSYLHRLFRTREITLSAWIRHQRLERAATSQTRPCVRFPSTGSRGGAVSMTTPLSRALSAPPMTYHRGITGSRRSDSQQEHGPVHEHERAHEPAEDLNLGRSVSAPLSIPHALFAHLALRIRAAA